MTAPAIPAIEDLPLEQLHEWPRNPRRISKPRLEQLKRALVAEPEMLRARPLIALPDGTVVAGNQRLRAARELGWESLPVCVVDLEPDRAAEWALRDNQGYGEDDELLVGELLAELAAAGRDVDLTGYDSASVDRLLAAVRPAPVVDPDEVPALPVEPRSRRGEVYELGPHRLMCGDACDEGDVAVLLDADHAELLLTDAPYGVGVDHRWREEAGKSRLGPSRGAIEGDDRHDWSAAYALVQAPVAYVWHSALHSGDSQAQLALAGYDVRQQIVWAKAVFAIGRSAYQWKHETCWYAVRRGEVARWYGGRAQTTIWEAPSPIHIFSGGGDDTRTPHPTQKPVALFSRPIENHTNLREVVVDTFAGSGTTMIACEQLGRRALCMEIDSGYCDVIRQRYADFTGQPELAP